MNLDAYAFDSESDDEEEETRPPVTKGAQTHVQDINKVSRDDRSLQLGTLINPHIILSRS
jgi:hypothetical protein